MKFEIKARSASGARVGVLETPHGTIETPVFMPVGTLATVKSISPDQLREIGVSILLANAYHLSLRPGSSVVRELGGLHRFMGWDRPILTDSGGFQVFSLAAIRKVTEAGVEFRSHIDGSRQFLGPEEAISIQEDLGADIVMVLDDCPPFPCDTARLRASLDRTLSWAARCKAAKTRTDQALFAIVQGGTDLELRAECARHLVELDFDGYAIGGVSVGEGPERIRQVVRQTTPLLPEERPRYLMGVGSPGEIVSGIAAAVDLFDCVLPTRNGRNGLAFTSEGRVRIRGASHTRDPRPLDPTCDCPTCRNFSRGYLRHLARSGELLSGTLVSMHNIYFLQKLTQRAREAIEQDTLEDLIKWCDRMFPITRNHGGNAPLR